VDIGKLFKKYGRMGLQFKDDVPDEGMSGGLPWPEIKSPPKKALSEILTILE
jgi:hypothetical protein